MTTQASPKTSVRKGPAQTPIIATDESLGALALALLEQCRETPDVFVYVAASSERAAALASLLGALDPTWKVAHLPAWDCLPYDHQLPSRRNMGLRAGVFRWLTDHGNRPHIIVTSARAVLQRTAPPAVWKQARLELRAGDSIREDEVEAALTRLGYEPDEDAEDPGSYAMAGQVIDIFPAAAPRPCRIDFANGQIREIRSFDPITKRSLVEADVLVIDPASEMIEVNPNAREPRSAPTRSDRLLAGYEQTASLFDYVPDMALILEQQAEARIDAFFDLLKESYDDERAISSVPPAAPEHTFLSEDEWIGHSGDRLVARVSPPATKGERRDLPALRQGQGKAGGRAFADFVRARLERGPVVIASAEPSRVSRLMRLLPRQTPRPQKVTSWREVEALATGSLAQLDLPLTRGFQTDRVAVITPDDVLGPAASKATSDELRLSPVLDLTIGQPSIHMEHGLALIDGLETVTDAAGGFDTCAVGMRYADARLLVPLSDLWKVWPYDAAAEGLTLDRLKHSSWEERRSKISRDIATASEELARSAREQSSAPKLSLDWSRYDRFASRFPYALTTDQGRAIGDVIGDLQSGRRMDRLLCGDVGFGKTEVALHAIAICALAGKQAALLAPTTILARQHFATLQRRFRGMGLRIDHLSRLIAPAEARAVKKRLAAGDTQIIVGTHAILSSTVRFADLALVIVDEEQRFGAAHKKALQVLAQDAHRLTMTATPIPRTLQISQIGLRSLSLVTTPPQVRLPVRTLSMDDDDAIMAQALRREKQRGGQSFVVCPRIEDLSDMAERLGRLCPELHLDIIHGRMPAAEVDDTLMRFSDGEGDILLATSIIESGLDIPNANTMIIWRPDRFGLAQLHQLRGRVGRGSRRGVLYLLSLPGEAGSVATQKRLQALQDLSHLGAGFDISLKDLTQRGAGDLFGEMQSGHVNLLGSALYEHLLRRAVAEAQGQPASEDWHSEMNTGMTVVIPDSYIPEDNVRLSIYRRLVLVQDLDEVDEIALELEDRFGDMPTQVRMLLLETKLAVVCRKHRIIKVVVGPAAVALTCAQTPSADLRQAAERLGGRVTEQKVIVETATQNQEERAALVAALVEVLS